MGDRLAYFNPERDSSDVLDPLLDTVKFSLRLNLDIRVQTSEGPSLANLIQ